MDSLMTLPTTIPDIPAGQLTKKLLMYSGMLLIIAYALYLRFRRWQLMLQAQMQRSEAFGRLLDKFGGAKEFLDFLQTDQGRKLLEDPLGQIESPFTRVLRLVQWGVALLVIGVAMLLTFNKPMDMGSDGFVVAVLTTSLGCGLLIVALITYFLARRWDLFPRRSTQRGGSGA